MTAFPTVKLSQICKFINGGTPSRKVPEYFNGTVPWITGSDVNENVIKQAREYITEEAIASSSTNIVPKGSILLVTRTGVGKVAIAGVDICISQDFTGLELDYSKVDSWYLFYFIKAQEEQLVSQQRGATIQGITRDVVENINVPLPPLPEQRRIAELLSRADRLRQVRTFNDSLSASILPSVFLKMFGDPIQNTKGWDKVEINDLISDLRGGSPLEPEDFVDKGFPVLHKGAIKPYGVIELDPRKKTFTHESFVMKYQRAVVNRDYVAVTLRDLVPSGPSIGLVSALRNSPYPEYILAQGAYAFLVDKDRVTPEYLMCLSNIPSFRKFLRSQSVGSTQIHIRTPIYMEIAIPVPPLPEQEEFAAVVKRVESLRARADESARQGEELFQALLAQSFN